MPPLFLYATAFLAVLMVVTFVLCRRDDADGSAQAVPAAAFPAPERPSSRPGPSVQADHPAERAPAGAPLRRSQAGLRRIDAPASALLPALPGATRAAAATTAPMHPTMHPGAGDRATATPLHAGPRAGEAGAIDLLGRQIAELTRQVAELQAERQGFQDEIRRLHAIVADLAPPAPVRPLRPVRLVETEPRLHRIGS